MAHVRVRGFQIFKDRHGKLRCYHRKTRTPIDVVKHPIGSVGFFAECERIQALLDARADPKPGTLGRLVTEYRKSEHFNSLAPKTRQTYLRVFDYLKPIETTPLTVIDAPFIARLRDEAGVRGYAWGNYVFRVASAVFGWSIEYGYMRSNPAKGVKRLKRPKDKPRANRPWKDAERFAVLDGAPSHLKLPVSLMMYTGLDPCDVIRLLRSEYQNGCISRRRKKTGEAVWWPLPQAARLIVEGADPHDAVTICATSRGTPWTDSGLRASWRKFRERLEREKTIEPGLTLKGLRHTCGTILAEEGYSADQIGVALGHATDAMARHYSRDADRSNTMREIAKGIDAAENRGRTEVVKPSKSSVKPRNC